MVEGHVSKPTILSSPLTGRKVFLMVVAFFGVVIGVNLTMMRLAIQTLPGTEVDSAYGASLAYENEIVAAHDQNLRNWHIDAQVQRSSEGRAMLQVQARDSGGQAGSGLKFVGRFEAPNNSRADQVVTLAETGIGIYSGTAALILSGQWDLVLQADRADQRMFLSRNRVLLN